MSQFIEQLERNPSLQPCLRFPAWLAEGSRNTPLLDRHLHCLERMPVQVQRQYKSVADLFDHHTFHILAGACCFDHQLRDFFPEKQTCLFGFMAGDNHGPWDRFAHSYVPRRTFEMPLEVSSALRDGSMMLLQRLSGWVEIRFNPPGTAIVFAHGCDGSKFYFDDSGEIYHFEK